MINLLTLTFKLIHLMVKALAFITGIIFLNIPRKSVTHGSARFASSKDLKRHGMFNGKGLLLARASKTPVCSPSHGHLLCIAPTGSGKTTGLVLPNLLTIGSHASTVSIDPKGELFQYTYRNRLNYGPVYQWAPFNDLCHAYNPLDFVRVGTLDERDDADLLTSLLVPVGNNEEAFWVNEARSLILGLILYVLYSKPEAARTMAQVRHLLTLSRGDFFKLLKEGMAVFPHPIIQKTANAFLQKDDRQLSGVVATAQSKTRIWDSPRLSAATCTSDFALSAMKQQVCSLYITVPPEYLDTYYPAIRVLVGLTIAETSRTAKNVSHRVVFMLDEFANLGRLAPAETAISIARSAGLQLCMFVQDISQFRRVYGDAWTSFAANCDTKVFFGVNDISEAKRLSETIGHHTVRSRQSGSNSSLTKILLPDRVSSGEGETARALITPDEILNLPPRECIVLHKGIRPIKAKRLFFKDREFRDLMHKNEDQAGVQFQESPQRPQAISAQKTKKLPPAA